MHLSACCNASAVARLLNQDNVVAAVKLPNLPPSVPPGYSNDISEGWNHLPLQLMAIPVPWLRTPCQSCPNAGL